MESSPEVVPKKKPKLEYIPIPVLVKNVKYNPGTSSTVYIPSEIKTRSDVEENNDSNEKIDTTQTYVPSKIIKKPEEGEKMEVDVPQIFEKELTSELGQDDNKMDQELKKPEEKFEVLQEIPIEIKEQIEQKQVFEILKEPSEDVKKNGHINGVDTEKSKIDESKQIAQKERSKDDKEKERHSHSKSSSREKEKKSEKDKKHSSSGSKHSSSSSHKSSSSSSHKSHKSSRSSSKHRSSSSNDEKPAKSEKSKDSTKIGKSEKSKKSETEKSKKSDRKESSRDSEKSDKHSKHHSSSSSSKSKHRDREKEKDKDKVKVNDKKSVSDLSLLDFDDSFLPDLDCDEEEDEVMKQCRMIFDEYSSKEPTNEIKEIKEPALKDIDLFAESSDTSGKKRQAHENADKRILPSFIRKPNHVQSAMQSIYIRQEIVRKQKEKELAELEEKKKKLEEELSVNQTPLVNPSVFIHPAKRPSIAPVSNLLALQEAKKKVEALKAAKQSPYLAKTLPQTVPKGQSRKAHVATVDLKSKPAPPVLEPHQKKISYNIRMQYYNIMVTHCLNIYPNCEDAWDRAQTEELVVFNKCGTPNIYKSSALLAINKLKKESIDAGNVNTPKEKTISHDVMLAGKQGMKYSWSAQSKSKVSESSSSLTTIDNCSSTKAYKLVADCQLNEEQLRENGFPRASTRRGMAKMYTTKPSKPPLENERYCSRCSKVFVLDDYDDLHCVDMCNYHLKRSGYRRGCADNIYYCCQQSAGSDGCCFGNYHVSDYIDFDNLVGYVTTMDPEDDYEPSKKDMFALDCEMCYTTVGMELTRITVVSFDEKVVYDTLVKPENRVIDYNTK